MPGLILLILAVMGGLAPLSAADLPHNWPWRGVVVNSFETTPMDVPFLKRYLKINHVSLHLKPRLRAARFELDPAKAWQEELGWADSMLDACRKLNLTATVVNSEFPDDPAFGLHQASPEFWHSAKHLDDLFQRVDMLANHFHQRGKAFSAYQILAEPLTRDEPHQRIPDNWPEVRDRIIAIIRKHDPERWVAVAPGPGGGFSGYAKLKKLEDPRIIYTAHLYQPHPFTHQGIAGRPLGVIYPGRIRFRKWDQDALRSVLKPLREFQRRHDVPVWIGEFSAVRWGQGAEQYLKDAASLFDAFGWSWSYFAYKGYHGWNPDYNTTYATDEFQDWSADYVGLASERWQTLRQIFGMAGNKGLPGAPPGN